MIKILENNIAHMIYCLLKEQNDDLEIIMNNYLNFMSWRVEINNEVI